MTPIHARMILQRAGTVPVSDPSLIGFEPETRALDPEIDENAIALAKIVQENRELGQDAAIVKDTHGRLSAWVRSRNQFWNVPTL